MSLMSKKQNNNSAKKTVRQRDELGNMIFKSEKFDHDFYRFHASTYIFQDWLEDKKMYYPITDFDSKIDFEQKQKEEFVKEKIATKELFNFSDKNRDEDIRIYNYLLSCTNNYFKEVFEFEDNRLQSFDIYTIVIREKEKKKIDELITEYKLETVSDLIYYLISKTQKRYIDEIEYYERPESIRKFKKAPKEIEKLISIIERVSPERKDYDNMLPEIANITFNFPDINPIKIEDVWITTGIIEAVKELYNKKLYKNWKKDLINSISHYEGYVEKSKFKFKLAIALHNFFKEQKLFTQKPNTIATPEELLCIANILEYSSIKIGKDELSDANKIKNIRNYLNPKRNKLESLPAYMDIKINFDSLSNYFDLKFLKCTSLRKPIALLSEAYYITDRFDIQYLINEFALIIDCLRQRCFQIGRQFSELKNSNKNPEFKNFYFLISTCNEENNHDDISEISFKSEGKEFIIKEKLPLLLIQKALKEYHEKNSEEFDFDILDAAIEEYVVHRSHRIVKTDRFKQPAERFLPDICNRFYKFLLQESPPLDSEVSPINRYALIIAVTLNQCYIFSYPNNDEEELQIKVKKWLNESGIKNNIYY
jgi:hypothetical protein